MAPLTRPGQLLEQMLQELRMSQDCAHDTATSEPLGWPAGWHALTCADCGQVLHYNPAAFGQYFQGDEMNEQGSQDTWQHYRRTNLAEMRPYVPGESLDGVSVAAVDTPALGGMIARNPQNHQDQWYVAAEYFAENFAPKPPAQNRPPEGSPFYQQWELEKRLVVDLLEDDLSQLPWEDRPQWVKDAAEPTPDQIPDPGGDEWNALLVRALRGECSSLRNKVARGATIQDAQRNELNALHKELDQLRVHTPGDDTKPGPGIIRWVPDAARPGQTFWHRRDQVTAVRDLVDVKGVDVHLQGGEGLRIRGAKADEVAQLLGWAQKPVTVAEAESMERERLAAAQDAYRFQRALDALREQLEPILGNRDGRSLGEDADAALVMKEAALLLEPWGPVIATSGLVEVCFWEDGEERVAMVPAHGEPYPSQKHDAGLVSRIAKKYGVTKQQAQRGLSGLRRGLYSTSEGPEISFRGPREHLDALGLIWAERHRQMDFHGYDAAVDDEQDAGELARAATVYVWPNLVAIPDVWPWPDSPMPTAPDEDPAGEDWKQARLSQLAKGAALVMAEMERIGRTKAARHE